VHTYAMLNEWPTWKRSFPEDPNLPKFTRDIDELIQWRNENAKGKDVWVTEFGWDSSTKSPATEGDFAKWQDNSDIEQAQWLVRSFFVFATRDIQRAYIFFFNDEDTPQLHGASGLTRHYEPKPSFFAVSHLYRMLGNYRFSKVIHEVSGEACVFEFSHESDHTKVIWVAWSPTGNGQTRAVLLAADGLTLAATEKMPLTKAIAPSVGVAMIDGKLKIELDESPTYLFLDRAPN